MPTEHLSASIKNMLVASRLLLKVSAVQAIKVTFPLMTCQ